MKTIPSIVQRGLAFCFVVLAAGFSIPAVANGAADSRDYTDLLTRARTFDRHLVWIGERPTETESKELWDTIGIERGRSIPDAVGDLEHFLTVHTNSPWADRKSTRLNSSHYGRSRMPSSA